MSGAERGAALLEVLAAMVILSVAGLGLVEMVTMHASATAAAAQRERELWDEERLLAAHSLLAAWDLDLRLGAREVGAYIVSVQRPEPALYRIAIARAAAPWVEDLVTVVYRRAR